MAEADPVIASDTPATEEAPATAPKKRRWRRIALMALIAAGAVIVEMGG